MKNIENVQRILISMITNLHTKINKKPVDRLIIFECRHVWHERHILDKATLRSKQNFHVRQVLPREKVLGRVPGEI